MHDVTQKILDIHRIYGASDNTSPEQTSSSRSLNYSNGSTIQAPEQQRLTKIPFTFNWQDAVGLFGTENHFVRIDLSVLDSGNDVIIVNGYADATVTRGKPTTINTYESAVTDDDRDLNTVNTYEPAEITSGVLPDFLKPLVSIELINNKTGNQYIDRDLDVRLYTKDRQEWSYDTMYLSSQDYFYIGFHARNTRRLPYNVSCRIGDKYINSYTMTTEQRRLTPNL